MFDSIVRCVRFWLLKGFHMSVWWSWATQNLRGIIGITCKRGLNMRQFVILVDRISLHSWCHFGRWHMWLVWFSSLLKASNDPLIDAVAHGVAVEVHWAWLLLVWNDLNGRWLRIHYHQILIDVSLPLTTNWGVWSANSYHSVNLLPASSILTVNLLRHHLIWVLLV